MITCYTDFLNALFKAGFSMGGGNAEGIYSVITWGWNESPCYETPVRWHTGDPETDPWEWRIRVLEERNDVAYAKLFFKRSGYITAEWYPYFYAVRRGQAAFDDVYFNGLISNDAKRVYDALREKGTMPLHLLKSNSDMNGKEMKSRFDRAVIELQMRMFITMCARQRKVSKDGAAYGWYSTVFCLADQFFGDDIIKKAASLTPEAAADAIHAQVLKLNPGAKPRQIEKFIHG